MGNDQKFGLTLKTKADRKLEQRLFDRNYFVKREQYTKWSVYYTTLGAEILVR